MELRHVPYADGAVELTVMNDLIVYMHVVGSWHMLTAKQLHFGADHSRLPYQVASYSLSLSLFITPYPSPSDP